MALYDKASLVLIPSGTKAGTVYSQKPTSGDGDFDFTRSSYATRVNSQGLIEKERSNLLLQSNNFDTTWGSNGTLTSGQGGYDGSSDAWLFTYTTDPSIAYVSNTNGGVQTFSLYAKGSVNNGIRLYAFGTLNCQAFFDLNTGSVENTNNVINATIEDKGNGWYRCAITFNQTNSSIYAYLSNNNNQNATSGSVYIQDAQLEQGLVATDYIETTTSAVYTGITDNVPRLDYDGDCPSLLLEPQRTNLITKSEYITGQNVTVTYNDISSPEGVVNAAKFVEDTSTTAHNVHFSSVIPTNASAVDYTLSIFAKKKEREHLQFGFYADGTNIYSSSFDLTNGTYDGGSEGKIEDYGNGWYRCSFTASVTNSTGGYNFARANIGQSSSSFYYTGDGTSGLYYYGFQLEEGSYATSYIPTYGTTVTRNADDLELPTLSTVFDSSGDYTVFFEHGRIHENTENQFLSLRNVDYNYISLNAQNGGNFNVGLWNGSEITNALYYEGDFNVGSPIKVAVRVQNSTTTVFINGSEISIDKPYVVPRNFTTYQNNKNHRIHKELYISEALTDQECIDLTT